LIAVGYGAALAANDAVLDRSLVWFLSVATGAVTAAVVAALRRRLERAIGTEQRQVRELRQLDRLKDDFVATVSHELRTPVSSVYGVLETLFAHELEPPMREELLAVAHQQSRRLAELTNQLLSSAALDREELVLERQTLDAVPLVQEAIAAARARQPARAIEYTADGRPLLVRADALRLGEALTAILDNALKYTPPETPIEVSPRATSTTVELRVVDHGPGIPSSERERVFD